MRSDHEIRTVTFRHWSQDTQRVRIKIKIRNGFHILPWLLLLKRCFIVKLKTWCSSAVGMGLILFNILLATRTEGPSISTASLLTAQSCGVQSTSQREGMPPRQSGWVSLCKSHQVQHGQIQGPVPESGQSQAQVQAGRRIGWKLPCGEGIEGVGWWEAKHDPALCNCTSESQLHPGLDQNQHGPQVEGGRFLFSMLLWRDSACIQLQGPPHKKIMELLECAGGSQRGSEGWSTSPMNTDWVIWGCILWRREGSGKILQHPSST